MDRIERVARPIYIIGVDIPLAATRPHVFIYHAHKADVRLRLSIMTNVRSHMKVLQLRPEKIASFFNAKFTSYAA